MKIFQRPLTRCVGIFIHFTFQSVVLNRASNNLCWRRMLECNLCGLFKTAALRTHIITIYECKHEIRKRKANWIDHILSRNCLLKQVIEGKIKWEMEVTRRWGRRRKRLLDDLKDRRGYSHLKEEALDRTMWRNRFGGGFGPVVKQNTEWWCMQICLHIHEYVWSQ